MKTLGEIAEYVDGKLQGDPAVVINRIVHPALVRGPSDLALVLSANVLDLLKRNQAANAIAPAELNSLDVPNYVLVAHPRLALARLLELFERPVYSAEGIHPTAVIDPTAKLGEKVSIGPHCWVGPNSNIGTGTRLICNVSVGAEVEIGEKVLLHPGVSVGDRCQIGNRVIVQPGACIGGDGFSYVTPEPGNIEAARQKKQIVEQTTSSQEFVRINSIGHVVIEDDVEIGAGTCVDRGTLGETKIGRGTKIDNLVQIGHNVTVGRNCLIVAQVGMGGSAKVGERVVLGGQAGVPDHFTIGDDAVIVAQSGLPGDVPPRVTVIGSPAMPVREYLQQQMNFKRLPRLNQRVKELEAKVAELEKRLGR
ncbi:MAG: UDP-3-O-(3-hydroxymyristoyl)glucosamine N-acyltransferase [Verrucomicrobia bacterium]|nr:UDP-3-O-(3-hydroxymyristoyl)glucosamine N-acyltransferase [Verrucomicrobiota bacterium]